MIPPSTIAHYRITSKLGEGGMGAVYRATDTKLNRDVAIKIIPDAFAQDPDRMVRFTREAQVLAGLNHPNIATIHGVEEHAIVMELVEGQPPAGPLSAEEALPLIRQLIDALEYAHEKGIVHRDLKPANLRITPDLRLKVLDFGLAKALSSDTSPASDSANSPTLTIRATLAGVIMGTAAYMSPEQARGQAVDKRADIWSFGVVVYELLAGKLLFEGATVSDTLAAVLRQELDLTPVPARFHRLIRLCLTRDPRQRLRDISGARLLLDEPAAAPPPPAIRPRPWGWAAAAVMTLAAAALAFVHFREAPPPAPAVRFQMNPPDGWTFSNLAPNNGMALSPDGRYLAFVAMKDGGTAIFLQSLDSLAARQLPGTENAGSPFWSPDSRSIGFFTPGKVKRVEVAGGPPVSLCDVRSTGVGGTWNRNGVILFGINIGPIHRTSAGGSPAVELTKLDASRREGFHARPWFLPDGRHFLYLIRTDAVTGGGIYAGSLDGGTPKFLTAAREAAVYAPLAAGADRGHLLFLREGTLMAQPFVPATTTLTGDAFPLAEKVGYAISNAFFTASATGTLAFRGGGSVGNNQLRWFDRAGHPSGDLGPVGLGSALDLSRDGKRVAFIRQDGASGEQDVWLIDTDRGVPSRFTFTPELEATPFWSPDGARVAYRTSRFGSPGFAVKDANGSGAGRTLLESPEEKALSDWSADGKYLLFNQSGPAGGKRDLFVLPLDGGKPEPYLSDAFDKRLARFSPGSPPRWVAYTSNESGLYQVYVQSFPAGRGKFQVSTEGGAQPEWRADGKELYYLAPDNSLMAVSVRTEPNFESGLPQRLFFSRLWGGTGSAGSGRMYAASRDGQRFLIQTQVLENTASPIVFILNWAAGLKRQ